jgi:short-subunit dehydrogenase
MVLGVKLGMKYMSKQSHGGLIVNTASTMGLKPFAYGPVHVATKHGVVGLSRSYGVNEVSFFFFILLFLSNNMA